VKILITGANSFVGTNFRNFSKFKYIDEISLYENKPEDIDFGNYNIVLHLAAIVHQSKKIDEIEYMNVNRDLCLKVAKYSKKAGVSQFVFLSTCKVYGDLIPNCELRNENSRCFPDDSYGRSKFEAEVGLIKLEDVNFTISIIRTPLVYGEGVKANMMNIVKLIDYFPILPFGSTLNKRNFTYTENLVGFIDRIIELRASGIFIAMDEYAISLTELVRYISKYLNKKILLFKLPGIFTRIGNLFAPLIFKRLYGSLEFDNSRTKSILSYKPPYTTEEGIKKMVLSYNSRKKS